MKTLVVVLLLLALAPLAFSQDCGQDSARFTRAKIAIAKEVLAQEQARLKVCQGQPASKRGLCAEWANAGNAAAVAVEVKALAQIDKLARKTR